MAKRIDEHSKRSIGFQNHDAYLGPRLLVSLRLQSLTRSHGCTDGEDSERHLSRTISCRVGPGCLSRHPLRPTACWVSTLPLASELERLLRRGSPINPIWP